MAEIAPASLPPHADNGMSHDDKGIAHRPRQHIGDMLRRARLEHGGEIDAIAKTLRIRADYIAAIEQARYDRLPGVVYAIGFVRTYAIHLGLDGEEAVRRFKLEAAGRLDSRRDLSFPMPLSQRAVPGGRMLLAASILAVCFYGTWYYLSTGDRARQERVAAVPTALLPAPSPTPAKAAAAPSDSTGSALAAASLPPIHDAEAAPVTPIDTGPSAPASAPAAPAPAVAMVTPPAPPAAAPPAAPGANTPSAASPPASPPTSTSTPAPPSPTPLPTPVAMAPADTAAVSPPSPPAPVPVSAPMPAGPRTYGAINGPSRIMLHAVKDCWIQVNDENDKVIAQRILHPGDMYRVPDREGLVLRTGNGSGLEISVDDHPAPGFGGTVHRNITLDPARIAAGTAIN
jgi:cytoskeleton protein RodZ